MIIKNRSKEDSRNVETMSRAGKVTVFIGSVLGALLLWIYAIGYDSTLFERTFSGIEVAVEGEELLSTAKGYTLASEQNFSSITVVAKGKRSELNELDSSDFRAVIDVSRAENAGYQTLNIIVYSPNGIEVVSQSSATAEVFIDEFTQRNDLLSVKVDTGDNYIMTEGVTFVDATSNPLSVTVSGPKSVLDTIEGAYVRFDLDGHEISNHINGYGAIELRDINGNVINNPYLSVSESTAYVTINVSKQKVVPVRVNFIGGVYDPTELAVKLSAQSVTVSGSPEALESVNELVLDIDERTIDGYKSFDFAVGSMLPAGVTNESGSSKITVEVTMPELSVRNYRIEKESITVENLPAGDVYEVTNGIDVTLIGPREAFENFDRTLMTAKANFDRVTVEPDGSYTAEAEIILGSEYSGIYVQSRSYTVNFTVSPAAIESTDILE